jgi:hypothetical protein
VELPLFPLAITIEAQAKAQVRAEAETMFGPAEVPIAIFEAIIAAILAPFKDAGVVVHSRA